MHLYVGEVEGFLIFCYHIFHFREYCGIMVVFYFKNAKCEKFPPTTFKFCYYISLWMCMNCFLWIFLSYVDSSRLMWIKNSSCECNFHPECFFFLPTEHNMKYMYTKFRRKKRSSQRRKIHKNYFACSAASPRQQWTLFCHMPEEWSSIDTEKKWQLLLLRFSFLQSLAFVS